MYSRQWIDAWERQIGDSLEESARLADKTSQFPQDWVDLILKDSAYQDLVGQIKEQTAFNKYNQLIEVISKDFASLASILMTQTCYGLYPLLKYGNDQQKEAKLQSLLQGDALAGFAHSEEETGSRIDRIRTLAKPQGEDWLLTGHKAFVSNGSEADFFYVTAKIENQSDQWGIFIVERNQPGLQISPPKDKVGVRAMSLIELDLDQVRLSSKEILGIFDQAYDMILDIINHIRLSIVSQALGLTQASLEKGLEYLCLERQIGSRLIEVPDYQLTVATIDARYEAIKTYQASLVGQSTLTCRDISHLKLLASRLAKEASEEIIRLSGGHGFMKDNDLDRVARDARATEIYGGSSLSQGRVIAKQWLDNK